MGSLCLPPPPRRWVQLTQPSLIWISGTPEPLIPPQTLFASRISSACSCFRCKEDAQPLVPIRCLGLGVAPLPLPFGLVLLFLGPFLSFCFLFFPFRQPQQPIPKHSRGADAAPAPQTRTLAPHSPFPEGYLTGVKDLSHFGGIFVSLSCSFSFVCIFFFQLCRDFPARFRAKVLIFRLMFPLFPLFCCSVAL